MADAKKEKPKDALADYRDQLAKDHAEEHDALQERHDHAMAMASVPQKVVDANEAAALETITGAKPLRDTSEAPEPAVLGVPKVDADEPSTSAKVS